MIDKIPDNILQLIDQANRERVSPKLEAFRSQRIGGTCPDSITMRGARGGRGSGAKSWSFISLIIQEAHRFEDRYACFREIQNTLEESVYHLIEKTVDRLKYRGWHFKNDCIDSPSGSHFIFRGLKDLTASQNVKSLEGFTRFVIEEASSISDVSIDYLLPTLFRNDNPVFWFVYNQNLETDPITTKIWNPFKDEPYAMFIDCMPGAIDNPWWNDHLEKLSQKMKAIDPNLWDHIYGGNPISQLYNAAISRILIRAAMDRVIDPDGAIEVGCDPADEGNDRTEIYKRKGLKIIDHKELRKMDGEYIANECWIMAGRRPDIPIKVDVTGIGASTRDNLRRIGAKVVPINFGSAALHKDQYPNTISEMWFNFSETLSEADIPDDPELMSDLASRLFKYDSRGRRCIEPKQEFKKRHGRSPDKGDALLLCFYTAKNIISADMKRALAERYRR